jgi:hypothetical protein
MSPNYCCCCWCHWVVFCTWALSVFCISLVHSSNPLRRVLIPSNSWWVEVDYCAWTGGGNPSESEEWACCSCHHNPPASCQPNPLASCGCRVYPQLGWYLGVCMEGSYPVMCVEGTSGVGVGGGWWEPHAFVPCLAPCWLARNKARVCFLLLNKSEG